MSGSDNLWAYRLIDVLPSENKDPLMYGGLNIACRDLARFGQLWLQRGVWSGERIIEDAFYEQARIWSTHISRTQ